MLVSGILRTIIWPLVLYCIGAVIAIGGIASFALAIAYVRSHGRDVDIAHLWDVLSPVLVACLALVLVLATVRWLVAMIYLHRRLRAGRVSWGDYLAWAPEAQANWLESNRQKPASNQ